MVESAGTTLNLPPLVRIHSPDVTYDRLVRVDDIISISRAVGGTNDVFDLDGDGKVTTADVSVAQGAYYINWPINNLPEGRALKLFISALDIEKDPVSFSAANLPAGA